jgi:hypothetical protein
MALKVKVASKGLYSLHRVGCLIMRLSRILSSENSMKVVDKLLLAAIVWEKKCREVLIEEPFSAILVIGFNWGGKPGSKFRKDWSPFSAR